MEGNMTKALDLNNKTNLTHLEVFNTTMQYFPEGDCNNTTPVEEQRALNLPNLTHLQLKENKLLLKMPNITGMTGLLELTVQGTLITAIPGKPFINNRLEQIELSFNKLIQAPNLEGACTTLTIFSVGFNKLTYLPYDYFDGCKKLKIIGLSGNKLTAFPNFAPIGSSLIKIVITANGLDETIPKDAIAMHPNLEHIEFHDNNMPAFEISFCNLTKQLYCTAWGNKFTRIENPYRDCIESIGTLPKPKLTVDGRLVPCDQRRCWMKQYGFKTENVDPGRCPDGREWNYIPEEELCGRPGELSKSWKRQAVP